MEKKSCCCAGEAETVNVNMETTGVTGAEAANTVTAETETPSDDAVCHCRHKHRTEKEEKDLLTRLNRIEGQVRGIKAMVQDERYCPDILVQVSAVQSALNGFCKVLLSNHIKTCVVEDIKNGNEETAVAELCETIKKMMQPLPNRAISKECEAEDTEGRDDLADDPDDGIWGAVAGDPVDDPDTHSDRHKNDQCEVRSSQRNYIESAETGSDQHGNGKKDSDCFHKNAPSGYKITENLS